MGFKQHPKISNKLGIPLDEGSPESSRVPTILGVPFYEGSLEVLVKEVIEIAEKDKKADHANGVEQQKIRNRCVSAVDAHVLIQADKDPEYKKLLNRFYLNLPDGMPIVWLARRNGFNNMQRCYGPDLFELLMKESSKTALTHFLCGGKEGVAEELKIVCEKRFGNQHIVGTYCPPFREMNDTEMKELGEIIRNSKADIIWIGLGAPKQEKFAAALSAYTDAAFLFTVGAAFDFYTNRQRQAPRWMQRSGLEWLFRLLMEPKRLGRRYAEVIPKFIWLIIISALKKTP
jgi:N-acetylglucosaminyldiphosphoundecaprenol N-acetyl-beta-D-mannosaminyltransferase